MEEKDTVEEQEMADVQEATAQAQEEETPGDESARPSTSEELTEVPPVSRALKKPLDKMTVKELRDVAKELGAVGVSGMKKEELQNLLRDELALAEARPQRAAGKKAKKTRDVKELKARISTVKLQRQEALEHGDRRMATIYRRRISRLKKQTRKAPRP
jgi:hypothetical protein